MPSFIARLAATPIEHQFTSAITVGEMVYGAERSSRREYLLLYAMSEAFQPMLAECVSDHDHAIPLKRFKVGSGDQIFYVGSHHSALCQRPIAGNP